LRCLPELLEVLGYNGRAAERRLEQAIKSGLIFLETVKGLIIINNIF
jgi:hypothetical protein